MILRLTESNLDFFKQKTADVIGTGDWSSDVCSSDLYVHCLRTDGDNIKDFLKVGGDLLCRGLRIIEHKFASFRFFLQRFSHKLYTIKGRKVKRLIRGAEIYGTGSEFEHKKRGRDIIRA